MYERAIALVEPFEDPDERRAGVGMESKEAVVGYAYSLLDAWELAEARRMLEPVAARSRASGSADLAGEVDMLAQVELNAGNLRGTRDLFAEAATG